MLTINHLQKSLSAFVCLLALGLVSGRAQEQQAVDGIAAIVNTDVITLSQVREVIYVRERSLQEIYRGAELERQMKEIRQAALNDLIDRQLILQEFRRLQKERGATIPEYVVDDRINTIIREEFGGDRAAFIRTLRAQGYSLTQFREIERDKIIVQAMRQQFVKDDFVISPTQIQKYYAANRAAFSTPEQIKLRMIVIHDDPFDPGKKMMAEEIREKLAAGADFERMAMMYSEDSTQEIGGDWGWIERNTLNKELSDAAFRLKAGEISPVIKVGESYYILLVEARKNATVRPLSEVREEIERRLIQEERAKLQQRWIDSLRKRAYIKIFS